MSDALITGAEFKDLGSDFVVRLQADQFAHLRELIPDVAGSRGRILIGGSESYRLEITLGRTLKARRDGDRMTLQLPREDFLDLVRRLEPLTKSIPYTLDHIHIMVEDCEPPSEMDSIVLERIDEEWPDLPPELEDC